MSGPAIVPKYSAVATLAIPNVGLRVYAKDSDAEVHEACHDISVEELETMRQEEDIDVARLPDGWYEGTMLKFKVHQKSKLCACWWMLDGWPHVAVVYQAQDGHLREKIWSQGIWTDSDLIQANCAIGTSLAVVSSASGLKQTLFFQDQEDWICFRHSYKWQWQEITHRLVRGYPSTGIAATTWGEDCNQVRLYCQNEHGMLCEQAVLPGEDQWRQGGFPEIYFEQPISLAVTSCLDYYVHLRLFVMGWSNGGVSEYQYDLPANGWKVGPLRACYHTDKISQDISSFVMGKDLKDDPIYGVMWTRPNVVWHSMWTGKRDGAWLHPVQHTIPFDRSQLWNKALFASFMDKPNSELPEE